MSTSRLITMTGYAKTTLSALLAFGLVHLIAGHDLGLGEPAQNILVAIGTLGWAFFVRKDLRPMAARGTGLILVAVGLVAVMLSELREVRIGSVLAIVLGMMRMLRSAAPEPTRAIAHGTIMSTVLVAVVAAVPAAYHGLTQLVILWSGWFGGVFGSPQQLGPTPFGFWGFAGAALTIVARHFVSARSIRRLAADLGCLILLHHLFVLALCVGPGSFRSTSALTLAPWVALVLEVALTAVLLHRRPQNVMSPTLRRTLLTTAVAAFGATLLALPALLPIVTIPAQPRIALFGSGNSGLLDWHVPEHGRYGAFSQGMFGLLPKYLEADGCDVTLVESAGDPSANLADIDLLVAINPDRAWTEAELKRIWSFVHDGGTLLVLGDHTDVGGTRASENGLLAPVGIEFNYDSALANDQQGWGSGWTMFHPLANLAVTPAYFGIGVGASLTVDPTRARPLLMSRFGFSDLGDQTAKDRAFLGDYSYSVGERAGDIVLAAAGALGSGRMVAFGDTSGFQNVSLAYTWDPLLRGTFRWLTGDVVLDLGVWDQVLSALGALTLLGAWLVSRGSIVPVAVASGLLLTVPVGGRALTNMLLDQGPLQVPAAMLDMSHGPRIDNQSGSPNEISGLVSDLHRYGWFVQMPERFDTAALERVDVFVTIAPVTAYTDPEITAIERFVDRGGLVIVACGFEHQASVRDLLSRFGLGLSPRVIGRIPFNRPEGRLRLAPEFVHASPVVVTESPRTETTTYNTFQGLPTVVAQWRGKGGIALIGDSFFFDGENYSSMRSTCLPNIRLLQCIVRDSRTRSKKS